MTQLIAFLAMAGLMALTSGKAVENPPSCERLTGALTLNGAHFLFFGNTFIALDDNLKQNATGEPFHYFRAPYPDAAFDWSMDHVYYIFSDKYFFSYWSNYSPVDAVHFGGDFFKDGLDAAGNLNGTTLFFKGCKYVESLPHHPSDPMDIWKGVPCNLDAALTMGRDLWLFKYDKLWIVRPGGVEADMPLETSSVIHLNDIKLCKEENKDKK